MSITELALITLWSVWYVLSLPFRLGGLAFYVATRPKWAVARIGAALQ